jgi:hypothetical protein
MIRIRALVLLLALLMLAQNAGPASAQSAAAPVTWKPGIYLGMISIDAHEYVSEQPLPPGTLHEEHTLDIKGIWGRFYIIINNQGKMSISSDIPIRFTYMDWSQVEDVGTGICEGQRSESSGQGHLRFNITPASAPTGDKFSLSTQPFSVDGFSGNIQQFGNQCPEVEASRMRDSIEFGFKTMFKNTVDFEVKLVKNRIVAGYCYLRGYELEGDHAFDCTWYVQYFVPKRK